MIRVSYVLHYGLISGANTAVAWMGTVTFRAIAPRRRYPIRFGVGEIEDIEYGQDPARQEGRHPGSRSQALNYTVLIGLLLYSLYYKTFT